MKNLVGLVTGGASGLGKASAIGLLSKGMRIVVMDKSFSSNDEENTLNMISTNSNETVKERIKRNCIFVSGDILSTDNVITALEAGVNKWGKINVVLNCAGTAISSLIFNRKRGHCVNYDIIRKTLFTNLCGTFNVIRLASQQMAKNKICTEKDERGVIINTGSLDAFKGCIHGSMNAASFGAISSMTLPISRDLSSLKIRVVTISPGCFDTSLLETIPSSVKNFLSQCNAFPCRLGQPSEYATCVESVIENKMLNGETIQLDAAAFIPSFDIN